MEPVNVYVRNENCDEDGIWDDELLIKAYNKSVDGIKEKIAKRMGVYNDVSEKSDVKENEVTARKETEVSEKSDVKENEVTARKETEVKGKRNKMKWSVGDFCRGIYSDDGLEYEAQIIHIFPNGECVVKYCGYGNEETVQMKRLKKSLGENSRSKQQREATNSKSRVCENRLKSTLPSLGLPFIPPPPPLNITNQFTAESESDAMSAMLMSWYMSGFHTGYYRGLMEAKKKYASTNSQ